MNFNESLIHIEIGDIVSIRTAHGLFGYATKFFTGVYTHSGLIVKLNDKFWVVELNGGKNHAIPYSQLVDTEFDIFHLPSELDREEVAAAALESLETKVSYGYITTVATGINEFFGLNRFIHWRNILDCTGYIMKILESKGWPEHSYIVSPTKFSEELNLKLQVRRK